MTDRFHIKSLSFLVLTIAAFVVSLVFQSKGPLLMPWLFLFGFVLLLLSVVFFSVEDDSNKERAAKSV